MTLRYPLLLATALGTLASVAHAQQSRDDLLDAMTRHIQICAEISDSQQRLACYDRTAPALVTASKSGEISIVDRGQLRQARRSLFGFSMPKIPFFSGDQSASDTPDQIEGTIKSAQDIGYGKYRLVLTEGNAIWETTDETNHEPRSGQKIVIRRGPMGSYFLRINGQAGIKGRRVG